MFVRRVAVACAALAVALAACGGDDDAASPRQSTAPAAAHESIVMWQGRTGTAANPKARYDIVVLDSTSVRPRVLTPVLEGAAQPLLFDRGAWSPDGRQVTFTVDLDGDPAAPYRTDIYVMDADGSRARRLTRSERAFHPVWSPDGRTIAFAKLASSRPRSFRGFVSTIWTIGTDGGDERQLVPPSELSADMPGAWSPDGESFAFTRRTFSDPERSFESREAIYVVRADGGDPRLLIDDASSPAWSPDGRAIAFVSGRDRNGKLSYGDQTSVANELYVAHADGSDPRRLTTTRDLNERSPAWSPDGTRIAYTRGEQFQNAEATAVLLVEADGDCPTEIAADDPGGTFWYANPVWRPVEAPARFEPRCS